MQTQTAKEHLKALHDELRTAAEKRQEAAKSAKTELEVKLNSGNVRDKANVQQALERLEEAAAAAKSAADAKGAEVQEYLKQSVAAAKAALESSDT